jgi:hypothetical protein
MKFGRRLSSKVFGRADFVRRVQSRFWPAKNRFELIPEMKKIRGWFFDNSV